MKQRLLIAAVLLSGATFAQFTQTNEPQIGTSQLMYLCDSNATEYAGTTGTNVTWDYSTTAAIPGNTKTLSVVAASATAEAANYTIASKAVEIPGFMTSYFSSSVSSRNSKGFAFDGGASFGTIDVVLDSNDELLMNYPSSLNSSVTDAFSGTVYMAAQNFPATGNVTTNFDGTGTLILNATTTIPNVTRFKITESATATVPLIGSVTIDRLQYEYYDIANSTLPKFVYSRLTIAIGGGAPNTQNIILNSVEPNESLGFNMATLTNISVYPNPANETVKFAGIDGDATVTFINVQGKSVLTTKVDQSAAVNVSNLDAGVYFVNISTTEGTATQRLVIQ